MNYETMRQILQFHGISNEHISLSEMYTTLKIFGYDVDNTYKIKDTNFQITKFTHIDALDELATINHSHEYAELIYFQEATNITYQVGVEQHPIREGDLLMILPNVCHHIIPSPSQSASRIIIYIHRNVIMNSQLGIDDTKAPVFRTGTVINFNTPEYAYMDSLIRQGLKEEDSHDTCWKMNQVGVVLLILSNIFRIIQEEQTSVSNKRQTKLIESLTEYIDNNYQKKLVLSDVAEHFFVSKSTITHLFRDKLNTSFLKYLTDKRLEVALSYIQNDIALDSIYQQVGFSDYQTFYRAFKQKYGVSPSDYRNNKD